MGPRGTLQVFFAAIADIAGVLVITNMFGELTILSADLNKEKSDF